MSSPSNKSAEKTSKEVPKDELETKDATDDATPATVPDPKDEPQDDENYLDESPHASQTDTKKSPAKKSPTKKSPSKRSPAKSTAKPEAAAHTGEKRQRSIAEMLGGGKGKAVVKKARASSPAGDEEGAAGEEGEASTSTPSRRTVNGLTALKFIPFSMEEFTNGLTDDQKRLLQLEIDTLNKSWFKVLKDELTKPYFIKLKQFLWDEGVKDANTPCPSIYPPAADIYTWSRCTPLGRVKVVIIGQDPYHGPKQAHGLCFSMYKEIQSSYPSFTPPKHGSLISWANQGVLMLNTSLTVRAGQAGSHAGKGWETFTDAVVKAVDKYGGASLPGGNGVGRGVVFLAWGSWASKRVAGLDKKKHCILASAHPSPLSAHRGFLGNGHFKKTNDWLSQRYGIDNVIDWCALDADAKAGGEA